MKKIYLLLLIVLLGCDIKKRAVKTKTDRETVEKSTITTKRAGDTIKYTVPKITFKDTIIYTTNEKGSILRTVYDNKGNLDYIECLTSKIDTQESLYREVLESIKDKDKEKEETFDSKIILYIMIGLIFIVIVVCFFLFRAVTNNAQGVKAILKMKDTLY